MKDEPTLMRACAARRCAYGGMRYGIPPRVVEPRDVLIVMVAEAPPRDRADWYYAGDGALYARTTVQAFRDAGEEVESISDILGLGVYLTTAVKCPKDDYAVPRGKILACSGSLEREIDRFPTAQALMLMGDVAISAVNAIARRSGEPRPVPSGSTYRIRGGDYSFRGLRVYPSYVQAGPAFFIEKSKRRMIAEDIAAALAHVRNTPVSAHAMSARTATQRSRKEWFL